MAFTAIINLLLIFLFPLAGLSAVKYSDGAALTLKSGLPAVTVTATRAAVLVGDSHFFLLAKNADAVQPIASLTKLMAALVFLENNPGWENEYEITAADRVEGGRLNLFLGERVKIRDLFYTSLVASDNGATLALARATGLSEAAFVNKMNLKAKNLGLVKTRFSDPSGLSDSNVSTAREVAWLAAAALGRKEIREATARPEYRFQTLNGTAKVIESTDYLLFSAASGALQVLGGKTGYTDKAGYCFVGLWRNADGRELIAVALNSAGRNERFLDSRQLANWALTGYNWNNK
jgi:D-alanyl-D-alanine endopeptidase (penicillin-binding protein 7)